MATQHKHCISPAPRVDNCALCVPEEEREPSTEGSCWEGWWSSVSLLQPPSPSFCLEHGCGSCCCILAQEPGGVLGRAQVSDATTRRTWPALTHEIEINLVQEPVIWGFRLLAADSSLTGAELRARSGVLTQKSPKTWSQLQGPFRLLLVRPRHRR